MSPLHHVEFQSINMLLQGRVIIIILQRKHVLYCDHHLFTSCTNLTHSSVSRTASETFSHYHKICGADKLLKAKATSLGWMVEVVYHCRHHCTPVRLHNDVTADTSSRTHVQVYYPVPSAVIQLKRQHLKIHSQSLLDTSSLSRSGPRYYLQNI